MLKRVLCKNICKQFFCQLANESTSTHFKCHFAALMAFKFILNSYLMNSPIKIIKKAHHDINKKKWHHQSCHCIKFFNYQKKRLFYLFVRNYKLFDRGSTKSSKSRKSIKSINSSELSDLQQISIISTLIAIIPHCATIYAVQSNNVNVLCFLYCGTSKANGQSLSGDQTVPNLLIYSNKALDKCQRLQKLWLIKFKVNHKSEIKTWPSLISTQ